MVRQFSLFPAILPQCFEVVGSSFSEVGLQLDERQGSRLCAVPWHQACDPLVSIETPASGGEPIPKGGEHHMKKMFMAMLALVIGLSFGLATFAQADEQKPTTATGEKKKDEKDKKGGEEKKGEEKKK